MASRRAMAAKTSNGSRAAVVAGLHGVLAATFQAYRDTHLAHFNVVGPSFPQLHSLFEEQYREMWDALDTVAERLRASDETVAPEAFAAGGDDLPEDSDGLLRHLADGNRRAARLCQALVDTAERAGDPGTADLATQRAQAHEKHAWMLEATLA